MHEVNLSNALDGDRPLLGLWHVVKDAYATEALAGTAIDLLLLDMQHCGATVPSIESSLLSSRASGKFVVARPPANDGALIGQLLDLGLDAVVIPMVNSAGDARRAVLAATYPPTGERSWGPRRIPRHSSYANHFAGNDHEVVILPQIETEEAVRNLDEILDVAGIGGIMVGPWDLGISMGFPLDATNPAVRRAVEGILDKCLERHIPFGLFAQSMADVLHFANRGASILICGSDLDYALEGANRSANELRVALDEPNSEANRGL